MIAFFVNGCKRSIASLIEVINCCVEPSLVVAVIHFNAAVSERIVAGVEMTCEFSFDKCSELVTS